MKAGNKEGSVAGDDEWEVKRWAAKIVDGDKYAALDLVSTRNELDAWERVPSTFVSGGRCYALDSMTGNRPVPVRFVTNK